MLIEDDVKNQLCRFY